MKIISNSTIKSIALISLGAVFFYACTNKNTLKDWEELNESTKPEIVGKNIEIKQSRDGIVRFRAVIPKVIEQQKDDNPYIYICSEGIQVWQYDTLTQTNFKLTADSAYIIEPQQYYELWGNVTIEREVDSTFAVTDKLLIEQKKNLVHTDTRVVINKFNHIKDATAEGFHSDLAFEHPVFYKVTQGEVNYKKMQLRKAVVDTLENEETDRR